MEWYVRSLIGGANLHGTIGVGLEGEVDLRDTTGSGRVTRELELAEKVVVLGQIMFTLEHLDQHGGLVIGRSREATNNASAGLMRII